VKHVGRSRRSGFKCFLYILIKEGDFLVNVFCRCCPAELTKSFSFFSVVMRERDGKNKHFCLCFQCSD